MTPEQVVYNALKGYAGLTAIVSDRITPMKRKQQQPLPAVTYQRTSGVPVASLDGDVSNLDNVRIQVDSWAASLTGVEALQAQVRAAMRTITPSPTLVLDLDDYDDALNVYRRIQDYSLWLPPA